MRAALWGFVRSVQTEQPQWRLSLADGDASGDSLIDELFAADVEPEVALRSDGRYVRRLRRLPSPPPMASALRPPAYALHLEHAGRVDSLQFRGRARSAPVAGEVEVEVAASGLNFRDVMKALGIYPLLRTNRPRSATNSAAASAASDEGCERSAPGDRVMGFARTVARSRRTWPSAPVRCGKSRRTSGSRKPRRSQSCSARRITRCAISRGCAAAKPS